MFHITKVGTLRFTEKEFSLQRYLTRCGRLRRRKDFWTLVQTMHAETTRRSDAKIMQRRWYRNPPLVLVSNIEAIRRADAEAEKALKRARLLDERRAAKRVSATPEEMETMLVAAEAVLTETRETDALTVSALQQAHPMSHRAETTAESFFQADTDMTVTTKEQARKKQLDFLESMKVCEEVYVDGVPSGTHVMSGRWVDTMKTPTVWRSKYTARGYKEPQSDEGCFAATATIQGIRMLLARCLDKRDQGHEAFVAQAFLNAEVREGDRLYVQPPERSPKLLQDGRRVVWKVRKAMLSLQTSPRRWQEDVSKKLKEHGFIQDERDPCLFVCEHGAGHLHRGACGRHAGSGTQ